ncbi:tripartite tricarboxylate transporter permease [Geminicoccus roseus]|uniref:tripartite tricarboxylate transporter permease n=1 Tax=Geminicoccus roseus TaxID=404900 RepID=UPI000429D323|nr:tripartite tricarboxylate transporter permease [Geminicoccus roseus]
MTELFGAIAHVLTPWPLFLTVFGTGLGIVVGAIPGLTGSMLIALSLPITFHMQPTDAMVLLISMYTGSISGGLVSATLLRMPGTPASVMTTFDGFPMAKRGEGGRALGLGVGSSVIGGLVAWIALITVTRPLSDLATRFSPFDYFALVVMALVLISAVSEGSLLKGLLSGALGALFAFPGSDENTGTMRFTFDYWQLQGGLDALPVLVGVFAVGTILADIAGLGRKGEEARFTSKGILSSFREVLGDWVNVLRSSVIGTWIGILPGIGANIGSLVAYTVAKNTSRRPELFGKGSPEGIVASESANNATVGGALIPLIAMGIPGSVIDVFLMSALLIHGIQPGPLLFVNNADLVYIILAACLLSTLAMGALMVGMVGQLRRLMEVPKAIVLPVVLVFCVIGVFASNSRMFEVVVMLCFGALGFVLERARIPLGPFVIGFILAPLAEAKLRSGLMMTAGDITPLFTRPLSAFFLLCAVALLAWPAIAERRRRAKRLGQARLDEPGKP